MGDYQSRQFFYMIQNNFGVIIISLLLLLAVPFVLWFLYKFLIQRKAQEYLIPPLDRFDAEKLEALIEHQVANALKPMLQNNGYSEEDIKSILTKNSLKKQSFKR
jgi:Zn-dependent protease with chaperone function